MAVKVTYLQIPEKLKVGFQTKDNPLSYITYIKKDGSIAKEVSWNSWRNEDIPVLDFDNVPTTGFKLQGWGGGRRWSRRQAYCQVIDPRGFEFQISYENLMFILLTDSCIEGELSGSYVYGWDGPALVLTSIKCEDYLYSQKINTEVQRFNPKDCTVGHTYYFPNSPTEIYVYLGKLPYVNTQNYTDNDYMSCISRNNIKVKIEYKHIFKRIKGSNNNIIYLGNTVSDNRKLVQSTDVLNSSEIQKYIDEYYGTQTTNPQTFTTQKVSAIEKFNVIGKDITDKIKSYMSYPVEEWSEAFMQNGETSLYENNGIYYITEDEKTIYNIAVKKCCVLPNNYGSRYKYIMFDKSGYTRGIFNSLKTDEECYEYLKKYASYQLMYGLIKTYKISDDNTYVECSSYYGKKYDENINIDKLLSTPGKFICVPDKYYLYKNVTLMLNNNRDVKIDAYV